MLTSFKKKGNISTVFIAIFFGYNQTFSIITLFALPTFNASLYFNPLLMLLFVQALKHIHYTSILLHRYFTAFQKCFIFGNLTSSFGAMVFGSSLEPSHRQFWQKLSFFITLFFVEALILEINKPQ